MGSEAEGGAGGVLCVGDEARTEMELGGRGRYREEDWECKTHRELERMMTRSATYLPSFHPRGSTEADRMKNEN